MEEFEITKQVSLQCSASSYALVNPQSQMLMFISDNASNNDMLAMNLECHVSGGLFMGHQHHVQCFAHILNLVMQVSLFPPILLLPLLIQNNQAFLRMFLQKTKGKHSSGSDNDWKRLGDDVDKYSSMSTDAHTFLDSSSVGGGGDDNDNDNDTLEDDSDDKSINLDLDREREEVGKQIIDECEVTIDSDRDDLGEEDLLLQPLSVEKCHEACILLSKVCDLILLQGHHSQNCRLCHCQRKFKTAGDIMTH
jgi:hypothetical protein